MPKKLKSWKSWKSWKVKKVDYSRNPVTYRLEHWDHCHGLVLWSNILERDLIDIWHFINTSVGNFSVWTFYFIGISSKSITFHWFIDTSKLNWLFIESIIVKLIKNWKSRFSCYCLFDSLKPCFILKL